MALLMMALGVAVPLCLSTFAIQDPPVTPLPPTEAPTKPATLTTISMLLIGVDAFTATEPILESLTIVKYQTGVNQYYLFAVSPDTATGQNSPTAPAKTLRSFYAEDARAQRQALVTQAALRKISPQLSDIYVDINFDRQAITETIALLQPFECFGQAQTGEGLLLQYDALAPEAKAARLTFQGELLKCLFEAAKKQGWDFSTFMNKLGRHFYPTPEHAAYVFGLAPSLPESQFAVFFTPLNPLDQPTPQP